jgi:endo-1,4-beta-xylanase
MMITQRKAARQRAFLLISALLVLSGCATSGPVRRSGLHFVGNIWKSGAGTDAEFATYWNQVTPENAGKWGSAEPIRDQMRWQDLDNAYNYAKENGLPFRLHTLIWGQQQPEWITSLPFEQQEDEIREWFAALAERYPDVDLIDVVNEPLHERPVYAGALSDENPVYLEWVSASLRLARQYFPNASLGVNDYNILSSRLSARRYAGLIRELNEAGLVDHIGVQGHFLEHVSIRTVEVALGILGELELPIYITEFDLSITDDELQAKRMKGLITAFGTNPWVRGITLWGYKEEEMWRANAHLLRADATERPALTWLRGYVKGELLSDDS